MDIHLIDPPWPLKIATWFGVAWPILTAMLLRRGHRSSAPLLAMFVPVAVMATIAYLMLWIVMQHLAATGKAAHPYTIDVMTSTSRGGVWCAPIIFFVMLFRRHTPSFDRVVVLFGVLVTIEVGAAFWISATMRSGALHVVAVLAGGIASLLTAIAMLVRLILLRVRAVPSPAAATP